MDQKLACFLLNCVPGISYEKLSRLLDYAGSPEALSEIPGTLLSESGIIVSFTEQNAWDQWRNPELLKKKYEMMENKGITYLSRYDKVFPKRLLQISDCPFGVFIKGKSLPEDRPSAGIVGARKCTTYGRESAHFFGSQLAKAGISVVSGMALGIDGMAGRGALSTDGYSMAVLGSGADICYPAENIDLYQVLSEHGGILSERPPGYEARAYDFPIRNRLISGLSDVLIVIEAAENSGSMITVGHALQQGKDVFALPGRVGDRMSAGCNELIKSGASVLTCPEDIYQYFGLESRGETIRKNQVSLTREEKAILDLLGGTPVSMEELLQASHYPVSILAGVLVNLEIKGTVKKSGVSEYIRLI